MAGKLCSSELSKNPADLDETWPTMERIHLVSLEIGNSTSFVSLEVSSVSSRESSLRNSILH